MPRDTVRACTSVKVSVCPPDRRTAATTRGRLVRAHLHAIVGRDLRELLSVPRKRKSAPRVVGAGDDVSNALASVLATVTSGDDGGDVVFRPAVVQCQCCQRNEIQSDTHRLTVENNNSGWGGWGGGRVGPQHSAAQRSAAQRSAAQRTDQERSTGPALITKSTTGVPVPTIAFSKGSCSPGSARLRRSVVSVSWIVKQVVSSPSGSPTFLPVLSPSAWQDKQWPGLAVCTPSGCNRGWRGLACIQLSPQRPKPTMAMSDRFASATASAMYCADSSGVTPWCGGTP